MTEQPSTSPSPTARDAAQNAAQNAARSRVVVIAMVALILIGWGAWNAWDLFGTEGINPKAVKAMAKAYEDTCVKAKGDVRFCKRHIGTHHRTCLPKGIDRAGPDEPKRPLRYDQAGYDACMRAHVEADWAEHTRRARR